jgi:hypothetical protein
MGLLGLGAPKMLSLGCCGRGENTKHSRNTYACAHLAFLSNQKMIILDVTGLYDFPSLEVCSSWCTLHAFDLTCSHVSHGEGRWHEKACMSLRVMDGYPVRCTGHELPEDFDSICHALRVA